MPCATTSLLASFYWGLSFKFLPVLNWVVAKFNNKTESQTWMEKKEMRSFLALPGYRRFLFDYCNTAYKPANQSSRESDGVDED